MTTQIPSSTPYAWPHDSSLSPSTTALVIIDMQRDFLSVGGYLDSQGHDSPTTRFQAIVPRLVSLLSSFRRAGFPIYHTREGHAPHMATVSSREKHRSNVAGAQIGSWGALGNFLIRGQRGHDIIPELQPLEDEPVIDKPGRGAFTNTDFDRALLARGIRNLVVCGVTADACVNSTVREASDRGYDVLVVEDGVESISDELKKWSLEAIKVEGGLFGVTSDCKAVKEATESWMRIDRLGPDKAGGERMGARTVSDSTVGATTMTADTMGIERVTARTVNAGTIDASMVGGSKLGGSTTDADTMNPGTGVGTRGSRADTMSTQSSAGQGQQWPFPKDPSSHPDGRHHPKRYYQQVNNQ